MNTQQYLTFSLDNLQYAIEMALVQEVVTIPELTIIDEALTKIIGIINLQGKIIPIMHLNLIQNLPVQPCNLSDNIIVIQCQGLQLGIITNQINQVINLNLEEIKINDLSEESETDTALIAGFYQMETANIILLEPHVLITQLDPVLPLIWDAQMQLDMIASTPHELEPPNLISQNSLNIPFFSVENELSELIKQDEQALQISETFSNFYDLYCPSTTSEERELFRKRANKLKLSSDIKLINKLIPLAIIAWDNQYFGVDLELVRAFIDISNLTPIPCCPSHIIGNMNLRGEIITLVDIRQVLNLPFSTISIGSQSMLVQVDDIVAALPVQVLDMVELKSIDLSPLPTDSTNSSQHYFRATTLFKGRTLRILDLPKIFKQGGIAVNEEV